MSYLLHRANRVCVSNFCPAGKLYVILAGGQNTALYCRNRDFACISWHQTFPGIPNSKLADVNMPTLIKPEDIFLFSSILICIPCEASSMRDNLSACSLTYMLSLHSLFSYLHTFGDKQSMKVQKVFFLLTPIVVSKAILLPDSFRNTSEWQ